MAPVAHYACATAKTRDSHKALEVRDRGWTGGWAAEERGGPPAAFPCHDTARGRPSRSAGAQAATTSPPSSTFRTFQPRPRAVAGAPGARNRRPLRFA